MTEARNLYKVLGLEDFAAPEKVRKQYHKLSMQIHPDHSAGDKAAEETQKMLNEAYEVLGPDGEKTGKRSIHDRLLRTGGFIDMGTGSPLSETVFWVNAYFAMQTSKNFIEFQKSMFEVVTRLGMDSLNSLCTMMAASFWYTKPHTQTEAGHAPDHKGKIALISGPSEEPAIAG